MFSATNAAGLEQPITSQPKVANHPDGGVLVYFGTGRYLTDADNTNHDQQSFYAIWDKADALTLTRADLKGHSVIAKTTFAGYSVRTTSKGAPDWATQRGWYLDLPLDGVKPSERVLSTPLVLEFDSTNVPDRILFVTNTPTADPCANGGTTWLMELDLITGAPTATSVFDFTGGKRLQGRLCLRRERPDRYQWRRRRRPGSQWRGPLRQRRDDGRTLGARCHESSGWKHRAGQGVLWVDR